MRLLCPRLALCDPDELLNRVLPLFSWLFFRPFLWLWASLAGFAGTLALINWEHLSIYGAQRIGDPQQWLLLIIVYPVIKALHELAHCLFAKAGGAPVHEMGLTVLVFIPIPYVDASATALFGDKYQRMLVSAAGIMVEVLLASIAMFVWLYSDDGLLRDLAFSVMVIGGISTVLFNGNPLLRFDGYYILADAIEMPNLAFRSARYYAYLSKRYLLGLKSEYFPNATKAERCWFVLYGASSTVYRLSVCVAIALFLSLKLPVFGFLAALWLLSLQIGLPLMRQLRFIVFDSALKGHRTGILTKLGFTSTALFFLFCLPVFPSTSLVNGVVRLPGDAMVRAPVDGFVVSRMIDNGDAVSKDNVLVQLQNEQLASDFKVLQARVRELEARYDELSFAERGLREIYNDRVSEARSRLDKLESNQSDLMVKSSVSGEMHLLPGRQIIGTYVRQGDQLGWVNSNREAVIRVVASQSEAIRIRDHTGRIEVRLFSNPDRIHTGRLIEEVPLATDKLPSATLGSRAGGAIAVDARDEGGITALQRIFTFDIAIEPTPGTEFIGGRAQVRLFHESGPLLQRWYRAARNLVLIKTGH